LVLPGSACFLARPARYLPARGGGRVAPIRLHRHSDEAISSRHAHEL